MDLFNIIEKTKDKQQVVNSMFSKIIDDDLVSALKQFPDKKIYTVGKEAAAKDVANRSLLSYFVEEIGNKQKQFIAGGLPAVFGSKQPPKDMAEAIKLGFKEFSTKYALQDVSTPEGREKIIDLAYSFMPMGDIASVGNKVPKGKIIEGLKEKVYSVITKEITPYKTAVKDLMKYRSGEIAAAKIDSAEFINRLKQSTSLKSREAITFLREGTDVPKQLNRPDLEEIVKNAPKELKDTTKAIGEYLDDAHEMLVEAFGNDLGFVKDFMPRIWDIPKQKTNAVASWFTTVKNNPHLKKRSIDTLNEGIARFGLKPKTLDVAELLNIYDDYKIKSIYNTKFVDALKELTDDIGQKLIQRIDKAPVEYVKFDHPVLNRAMAFKSKEAAKKGKDVLMISQVPVKVHPELVRPLKVIFDSPFTGKAAKAVQLINAFVKKSQLTISMFHHGALSEAALGEIGAVKTAKIVNPVKIYNAIKNGDYELFKKLDIAKDAARHGVSFGALEDVQRSQVQNTLRTIETKLQDIPLVGKTATGIRTANDLWDKGLWDYYHNTLKLTAYETSVARQTAKHPEKDIDKIKDEVGQWVNDEFGGQNWETLMLQPKERQVMQWLFLSPDWTISTLRQAIAPTGIGAVHAETKGIRKAASTRFWTRTALYLFSMANMWNYANTKKEDGEGKWMWENDPGEKFNIFLGYDDSGRKQYVRVGKQFRELPELLLDPIAKLGGKLSPIIQQIFIQATGVSAGGWNTDLKKEMDAGKSFVETIPTRIEELLTMPIPFAIRGVFKSQSPVSFIFPVSKGLSQWEARRFYIEAIENKDVERIKEITQSLLDNSLNPQETWTQAKAEVKREKTYQDKDSAQELFDILKKLDPQEAGQLILDMQKKGTLTPEINTQLVKIIKEKVEIQRMKNQ